MSTISKTTFTFVVLHRTDEPFDDDFQYNEYDGPHDGPLGEAMARSYDGNAVGALVVQDTVEVEEKDVESQLLQLGNDGEFFDDDLNWEG